MFLLARGTPGSGRTAAFAESERSAWPAAHARSCTRHGAGAGSRALRSNGQWNNVAIAKRIVTAASVLPTVTHGGRGRGRRVVTDEAGMQDLVFVPVPILVVFGGQGQAPRDLCLFTGR